MWIKQQPAFYVGQCVLVLGRRGTIKKLGRRSIAVRPNLYRDHKKWHDEFQRWPFCYIQFGTDVYRVPYVNAVPESEAKQ